MAAHEFAAVVFDMDGIIFDSERRVIECWKEVAKKYNIPDIEQACIECTGINAKLTVTKMLERYGQDRHNAPLRAADSRRSSPNARQAAYFLKPAKRRRPRLKFHTQYKIRI